MTAVLWPAGAPTGNRTVWNSINWKSVGIFVKRLQVRIAKAVREKRFGKVKALQWLLTKSYYAKLLAIKRVTSNKGKRTAGVDKVTWTTSKQKTDAVVTLKRKGYLPQPLRRIYINQFQHYSKNSDRWAPKYARRPKRDILYIGIDTCVPMIESEKSKVRLNYSTSQVTEEIINTILEKASFVLNRQYSSVTLNEGPQGRKFIGVETDGFEYTALSMSAGEQKVFHIIEKIFKAQKSTLILIDD